MTGKWMRGRFTAAILVTAALLLFPGVGVLAPQPAMAALPNDIDNLPADLKQGVLYSVEKGYMTGGADGNFRPGDAATRLDYARAVDRLFGHRAESADRSISFKDLKEGDPGYREATLAVKHGYLSARDAKFEGARAVKTHEALAGLVRGIGLEVPAIYIGGIYPPAGSTAGTLVVAHNLRLKFRNTRIWPGHDYPRSELAFSLRAADHIDGWRRSQVISDFDWINCQTPWMGPERDKAIAAAFSKIGYPYVWGGGNLTPRGVMTAPGWSTIPSVPCWATP